MTTALLLTLLAVLASCLIRYPARVEAAGLPVRPAEGYPFGDPASPTRAESERTIRSWGLSDAAA